MILPDYTCQICNTLYIGFDNISNVKALFKESFMANMICICDKCIIHIIESWNMDLASAYDLQLNKNN